MIFEFPPGADYQLRSLEKVVSGLYPKHKLECIHGFSKSYTPGGFHLHRLLNLAWLYCLVPLKLIFRRPSWLLVRSAPPGIQVWVGLWAGLLGIPSIVWLMDYHPEIEARILDRKVFLRPLAWFLRIVDRFSLQFHRAFWPPESRDFEKTISCRSHAFSTGLIRQSGRRDSTVSSNPFVSRNNHVFSACFIRYSGRRSLMFF